MWPVIDENETGGYGKSIEKCKIKPVFLDLITDDDIKQLITGEKKKNIRKNIEVRLFKQSKAQGGVMSLVDVAAILKLSPATISKHIREFEKESNEIIPRRGTVHDMGPTVTHKRDICYKIIVEGKTVERVAAETNHSPEAITRYVKDYKRISACLARGLTVKDTSFVTKVSKKLIYEYKTLIEENNVDIQNNFEEIPF
jgi:DNA-binding CsgD family transcriptional regulator